VGPAVTVLEGPAVKPGGGMGEVFRLMETSEGGVLVFVVGDRNITGLGGMMAAGCKVGGVAGVIVDGAVRDVEEIEEMQLPVFSRGISPSTAVGRLGPVATNVTVDCAGVLVSPGDIIVGDADGVVAVPRDKAKEVLELCRQLDATEREMTETIWELKSLAKAFEKFGRI
jgi:regulator of RNase E activity RraA